MNIKKHEMDNLFQSGKRLYSPLIKIVYLPASSSEVIISAPIRVFKRAVDRNRIKRLIRESLKGVTIGNFHVAIIYNSTKIESFQNIKQEIDRIIPKIK